MATEPTLIPEVRSFLESIPIGVLATVRSDGRARQSTVYFVLYGSTVWITTESERAKAKDVNQSGWASLCVVGPMAPYPSVTVEGPAAIQFDDVAPMTARVIARITGGDVSELAEADLKAAGRVLLRIDINRIYGASYLTTPDGQE
jgi:PPOX class probable F420-dependent enzyme